MPIDYSVYDTAPQTVYQRHPSGLPTDWSWDGFRSAHPTDYDPSTFTPERWQDRYRAWITAGRPGWDSAGNPLDVRGERVANSGFGPGDPVYGNAPNAIRANPPRGPAIVQPGGPGEGAPVSQNPAARIGTSTNRPGFAPGFRPPTDLSGGDGIRRNQPIENPLGVTSLNSLSRSMGNQPGMTSPFSLGTFASNRPNRYQGYF